MTSVAGKIRRITKEFQDLAKESKEDFYSYQINEDNIHEWIAVVSGPPDSVYEGHKYKLHIEFTNEYPFKPPKMKFITPIYHPNVMLTDGEICLDILKEAWSPVQSITKVLLSIRLLMASPNSASALNHDAGVLLMSNPAAMKAKVAEMAAAYPI
jgi:ubiquitin-protein ligase